MRVQTVDVRGPRGAATPHTVEVVTDLGTVSVHIHAVDTRTGEPVAVVEFKPAKGFTAVPRSHGNRFDVRLEPAAAEGMSD